MDSEWRSSYMAGLGLTLATPVLKSDYKPVALQTAQSARWDLKKLKNIWATSREHLSSEFPTRWDSNRAARLQKLARVLNFRILQAEVLYYPSREQQRRWSDCADAQADLHLCCSHMILTGFLITWLIMMVWARVWNSAQIGHTYLSKRIITGMLENHY